MTTQDASWPDVSFEAAGDLSADQYLIMAKNTTTRQVAKAAADSDEIVGVLQNKPAAAGRAATVRCGAVTKVIAGATVAAGDQVTSDANGKAVKSTYSDADLVLQLGVCITGGALDEFIEVLVNVQRAHQGAAQA